MTRWGAIGTASLARSRSRSARHAAVSSPSRARQRARSGSPRSGSPRSGSPRSGPRSPAAAARACRPGRASPSIAARSGKARPSSAGSMSSCSTTWSARGSVQLNVAPPPALVPASSTTSASARAAAAAEVPIDPVTPTLSGWFSAIAPLPDSVVPTAADICSARTVSSAPAPECITPPPARMNGRCARRSASAAAVTSAASGAGRNAGKRPNRALVPGGPPRAVSPAVSAAGPSRMSCGRKSATGPGRPVVASRKACRTSAGRVAGAATVACHLVTGASRADWSRACDAALR